MNNSAKSNIDRTVDLWEYENKWLKRGKRFVAGTDEAGRGPLAGPVVAAAVIFEPNIIIRGLNDSKKIAEKKRELLYGEIIEKCVCYSISVIENDEIDRINILNASLKAMKNSVYSLSVKPDIALIDGNRSFGGEIETEPIIKGDSLSFSIAAASILAKVHRDRLMHEHDKKYPEYGFAGHKGYPTKEHYKAIAEYGDCPLHRQSFRLK